MSRKARVEKNSGAKRVWNDEDAIVIVQGLIDSLQARVSVNQLKKKIKTLN